MNESKEENLLGITFDQSLFFKHHVRVLCKKVDPKAPCSCSNITLHGHLETSAVKEGVHLSHFCYCPLVWMFYVRALNHGINHIHERALRIAYKDYESDFGFLLEISKSMPIYARNVELLMTESYKTKGPLNPPLMNDVIMQ